MKNAGKKTSDTELNDIKTHIILYNPSISHYRRVHAHLCLYLAPELNMFLDYKEKHPKSTIHIDTGRNCIKQHSISFLKLGEEECEACEEHKQHLVQYDYHRNGENVSSEECEECEVCNDHKNHVNMVKLRRCFYGIYRDVDDDETTYISTGMQKVIMLPRLPGCKLVIFQTFDNLSPDIFASWEGRAISWRYLA